MKSDKRMVRVAITITPGQAQWLKTHPDVNLSGVVRKKLNKIIENYEKIFE